MFHLYAAGEYMGKVLCALGGIHHERREEVALGEEIYGFLIKVKLVILTGAASLA